MTRMISLFLLRFFPLISHLIFVALIFWNRVNKTKFIIYFFADIFNNKIGNHFCYCKNDNVLNSLPEQNKKVEDRLYKENDNA
jgi:hypothetical protein